MVVADFDGDGRDDIAYSSYWEPDANTVAVLLSRAHGRFTPRITRTAAPLGYLITGDVNEDGRQDLVASSLNHGQITVLLGDGTGRFAERAGPQILPSATVRAVARFDADAHADVLVLVNDRMPSLTVLRGDGTGAVTASGERLDVSGLRWGLALSDFNDDGRRDVVLDQTSNGRFAVAFGDGAGWFGAPAPATEWNFAADRFALSDFNHDGRVDLGIGPIGGTMAFAGDGTGHFTPFPASRRIPAIGFSGAMTADFNGDGNPDLAATSGNDEGEIYVWLGNGQGRFMAADGSPEWGGRYPGAVPAATGDFNADGRPDLVSYSSWQRALRVHLNTGGRVTRGTGQSIRWIQASPREIRRGESVTLAARLRCHPGKLRLYRRPLRRADGDRWRRLETLETNYRGMAIHTDAPRVSVEYRWRAAGAAARAIKGSRPRTILVNRKSSPSR